MDFTKTTNYIKKFFKIFPKLDMVFDHIDSRYGELNIDAQNTFVGHVSCGEKVC